MITDTHGSHLVISHECWLEVEAVGRSALRLLAERNCEGSEVGLVECGHLAPSPLLHGAEGEALYQLVLCGEAGDDHGQ